MKYKKLRVVKSPVRGTEESAGIDIFIPEDFIEKKLGPNEQILIPAGLQVSINAGTVLIANNKSGVAVKKKLIVGACVIDSDYQGEIHIDLHNIGNEYQTLSPGMKITQLLHQHVILSTPVEDKTIHQKESERGSGGFGSTGTT